MSLFSKFTSLFQSKPNHPQQNNEDQTFKELLDQVVCPYVQFDLKTITQKMAYFLTQNDQYIDRLFEYVTNHKQTQNNSSLVQILAVIHQMLHCTDITQEISIKLKECRLQKIEKDDPDNLVTEPDLQTRIKNEQCYTEFNVGDEQSIQQYTYGYFNYLQRLAANIDLYRSASRNCYPYLSEKDGIEPKLMFLWHYKMQNLINSAIILLKTEMNISEIQKYVYFDVFKFQNFICKEIEKMIDDYITIPNADTLSLFEVYQESNRHYELLKRFQQQTKRLKLQLPKQCEIDNQELQEFLNFVSKLKVLNQMSFKKSLKVPNKTNPCMGIPTKNPQLLHLRSSSGKHRNDQDRLNSEESPDQQDYIQDMSETKKKQKKIHIRGQSTFQNK